MEIDISKKRTLKSVFVVLVAVFAWMIFSARYVSDIPKFLPYLLFFTVTTVSFFAYRAVSRFTDGISQHRQQSTVQEQSSVSVNPVLADERLATIKAWSATFIAYGIIVSFTIGSKQGMGASLLWLDSPDFGWNDLAVLYLTPLMLFTLTWVMTKQHSLRRYLRGYTRVLWGISVLTIVAFIVFAIYAVLRAIK